ncbi:probable protein transport Sec1a isoform X4 [Triticum aestivum]|uniref:probable protein transport Sec1a isoform X4 n=1 Tax=Triticum aestivum TaxID=4565 RepID=UPI001D0348D2|nr:probable protein transport Sec1a isoform X4 [Triticum aestivum]
MTVWSWWSWEPRTPVSSSSRTRSLHILPHPNFCFYFVSSDRTQLQQVKRGLSLPYGHKQRPRHRREAVRSPGGMSLDSDSSSQGGDRRSFRQITRDRLLFEMLRSTRKDSKSAWKVLIMDKFTVKIMSYSCKMADITEEGVSLVEDLYKRRQPLPSLDAIYFIQPTKENVVMFLSDMSGRSPLYKKAYVFFSSPIQKDLVAQIKRDSSILPRIGALSEMNLEYFPIDSQGFITDHERALEELFCESAEGFNKYNACLNAMATRISTVFASMREFPRVHYRIAKTIDASTMTTLRDMVPTKIAAGVWNYLSKYKTSIPEFPQTETCELLIVDRSVDQIAPIIHEWTYDAMCHDLLCMDGNKYVHEVSSKNGSASEKKEVLLEDHDPVWLELRHSHIADASERLHDKMTHFVSKNKAAQRQQARTGGELSTRDLQKMVQALPQYTDQIDKLSLHVEGLRLALYKGLHVLPTNLYKKGCRDARQPRVMCRTCEDAQYSMSCAPECHLRSPDGLRQIAGKLNVIIREQCLRDVGQLEQDLVFGDAGTKELINFFRTQLGVSRENKLRLLMIYAAINPEKFESDKGTKMMQELIEQLSKGELPKDEYNCMNDPSPSFHVVPTTTSTSVHTSPAHSMRSRRTGGSWARPRGSDDGYSSDSVLKHASSDFQKHGQRIFVFVIGGATRSELRAAHKLSSKLKREVILGSSSLDDPPQFITKLKMMSAEELTLDDLHI